MCLVRVPKDEEEDDYYVAPRRVRRERRVSPPSPRHSARISYLEPRRRSIERTYIIAQPAPPAVQEPEPYHFSNPPTPPPVPELVPETSTRREPQLVEVIRDDASSSGSSSHDDVRSRKTSKSHKTESRSEHFVREKEFRKERRYSPPQPEPYDTYRYVQAPPPPRDHSRGGYAGREPSRNRGNSLGVRSPSIDDPRGSRASYRRERERVIVVDDEGRRTREYRR